MRLNSCLRILRDYDPTDVFNMDGTGLFYKLLPNRLKKNVAMVEKK
jgi:hypothetical protein